MLQAPLRLDLASLAKQYSSLFATSAVDHSTPQLSQHQVSHLYDKGLAVTSELQKKFVESETLRVRHIASDSNELTEWVQGKHAACNRSAQDATPEDIMVYFTQHWVPVHAGSMTMDGELTASPGSLSSTHSCLSINFEIVGRNGEWNAARQTGNLMQSAQIKSMLEGYSNHATDRGQDTTPASEHGHFL